MYSHPDVYSNTLQRPCPTHEFWQERFKQNKYQGNVYFVAEIDNKVIGTLRISTYANPRRKHVAEIGVMY
ncbi:GNAT family N-acetyltransferase [Xenorhabdus hominickii]|uniref:GNAT family N-acetyltransferase n=1 Tax=Xenorhabdus hominickii TaxID=351679 RepID=UPI003001C982